MIYFTVFNGREVKFLLPVSIIKVYDYILPLMKRCEIVKLIIVLIAER